MKKYTWLAFGILWGLMLVGSASADEASHRKAVDDLFARLEMAQALSGTVDQLAGLLTNVVSVSDEPFQRDVLDAYVRKYLAWDKLRDEMTALYMKAFTEAEIRELINFYNTPAGRKLLKQGPLLSQAITLYVQKQLFDHSDELRQMMMDAELKEMWKSVDKDINR